MAKSYSCKLVFFGGSSLLQFSIQKILYLLSATSRSVFSPWEGFLLTQGNSIYFYLSSSRTDSNGFCKPRTIFIPPAERSVTPTTSTLHLSLLPQNLVVQFGSSTLCLKQHSCISRSSSYLCCSPLIHLPCCQHGCD